MSSRDPWAAVPNLSGIRASDIEDTRTGDPSRVFPSARAGVTDAVTGRILNVPRVSLYRTTATAGVTTATLSAIPWEAEAYDTDNMWSAASAFRIYARTEGVYTFKATTVWASNSTSYRESVFRKNGATYEPGYSVVEPSAVTITAHQIVSDIDMNAGDYVELMVSHNIGADLNILGGAVQYTALQAMFSSSIGSDNQ